MTKEISTDAELMSRLLTTRPTPAECLVAAARVEQLAAALAAERAKVAKLVEALQHEVKRSRRHLAASTLAALDAAITEAGQ